MPLPAPKPAEHPRDANRRPYFLWDEDLSLDAFRARLVDPDPDIRAFYLGKLMRQARPDDVFAFVTLRELKAAFPLVLRYLGRRREFWTWMLGQWKTQPGGAA